MCVEITAMIKQLALYELFQEFKRNAITIGDPPFRELKLPQ